MSKIEQICEEVINSYKDAVVDLDKLVNLAQAFEEENDIDKKNSVKNKILDSLYLGVSKNSKAYTYVIMYSFLLNMMPEEEILLRFFTEIKLDDSLNYKNLYYLFSQIGHFKFTNPSCNTTAVSQKNWDLLRRSQYELLKHSDVDLTPIPAEELDENMALVVTDQFLVEAHGPTKTTLDRAAVLSRRMEKVLILNTCECVSTEGELPFWASVTANHRDIKSECFNVEWKGCTMSYFQCSRNMPDESIIYGLIDSIRELRPKVCVCVGGNSLFAGVLSKMIPVVVVGTTQSNLMATMCSYQVADRHQIELEKELIETMEYEDSIIEGKFTFDVIDSKEEVNREMFNIPEDAFVISVVGGRLQKEITDDFWTTLSAVECDSLYVIVVGIYELPVGFETNYPRLANKVVTMGFCSDAIARIGLSDLYVNPHRKGGATSAVEAMMQGIPVVTTNYGDVAGVAEEGFCCDSYMDYPGIIEKYIMDKDFYRDAQKQAKNLADVLLDSDLEFNRIIDVYLEKAYGDKNDK